MNPLLYRRQFLIVREKLSVLSKWQLLSIGRYFLYVHPDLEMTTVENSDKKNNIIRIYLRYYSVQIK